MKSFKIIHHKVIFSKKTTKQKIHCEELTERALKWFYERFGWQIEEDITNLYMKKHNIKDKDVDW